MFDMTKEKKKLNFIVYMLIRIVYFLKQNYVSTQLIWNVLVSAVQQSESFIHIQTYSVLDYFPI